MTKRIELLEKEREEEKRNSVSTKVKSIENDQYARRTNMLVHGIQEVRQENPTETVVGIIKIISICGLGQKKSKFAIGSVLRAY